MEIYISLQQSYKLTLMREAARVDNNHNENCIPNNIMMEKYSRLFLKIIILALLITIQYGCSNDNVAQPGSKLLAFEGLGSNLKIVELDPADGSLIATFLNFEPMQAQVDFDFTYFKKTNELIIRRDVFESGFQHQLLKVNINTKKETVISSEDYFSITAGNGKLYGFKSSDNVLNAVELVEVNPNNGSPTSIIETFAALNNAPQNNLTGLSCLLYSFDTNEILIPRRTSFDANAIDDLIKINPNSGTKTIVQTKHYESIIVGKKGRLFAIKKTFAPNSETVVFYGVVEVNKNNGQEINIIKEFNDASFLSTSEIIYLSETNEIVVNRGTVLYKINVDTGSESTIINTNGFYSYRSVNIF